MQQTDKYQLNLIEMSDTFSPAPLNENAQKLEAALTAARAEAAAGDAALDQRVIALEAHHIAIGTFVGNAANDLFELGFTPGLVIVIMEDPYQLYITIGTGKPVNANNIQVIEGGFRMFSGGTATGKVFHYAALG